MPRARKPELELAAVYKPSSWQRKFHSICNRDGTMIDEILGAGAAGPGKSLALLMNPFDKIAEEHRRCTDPDHSYPLQMGYSTGWCLHLRRISKTLGQTFVRAQQMFPRIDPKAKWYASDMMWVFSCGYRYQFGHCNERNDWGQYDSNQYDELLFDELVQFYKNQYDNIVTRVRSSDPVLMNWLRVRSMSNPNRKVEDGAAVTEDPYWVRDRFVAPAIKGNTILKQHLVGLSGKKITLTRLYLPALLSDNPDASFVSQYERRLSGLPDNIRKAMRDGDWFVTAGAYWSKPWDERFHVCRAFKVPDYWKFFRSMDWGFKKHGCVGWYALNPEGVMFKIREFTFIEMDVAVVAGRIKQIEISMGLWDDYHDRSRIRGPADNQLWEQRGDRIAVTKADVMAGLGVGWIPADKRSRARNALLLYKRLAAHDDFTKEPEIIFFECCHNTIARIPSVPTDPNDHEAPLDTNDDHWIDETLYACAYASVPGNVLAPTRMIDEDEEEFQKNRSNAGDFAYGQVL